MTQFYIVEIQQYANGEFGHIVHFAWDENEVIARNKADSKYYEVLSACAISNLPCHSVILFSTEGFPLMHGCYKHEVTPVVPDEEIPEEPIEEPSEVEGE